MKSKLTLTCALGAAILCTAATLSACSEKIDYYDYVSETRSEVYLYKDDGKEIKIYCSNREQPYSADGYKGDCCDVVEIYVTLENNPQEIEVSVEGLGGEMNYQAVNDCFYLSFSSPAFNKDNLSVTLNCDGKSEVYNALTVTYASVLSCEQALNCVVEYDLETFENLTRDNVFDGEIFIRLLYDDGCYYYVGVCDKSKSVKAYLLDGERGKIIATKTLQG